MPNRRSRCHQICHTRKHSEQETDEKLSGSREAENLGQTRSWPTWDGKDFDSRPAEKNTLAPPCLNRASLRRDVPWGGAVAADDEAASLAERNEYGSDDGRTEPRDMGARGGSFLCGRRLPWAKDVCWRLRNVFRGTWPRPASQGSRSDGLSLGLIPRPCPDARRRSRGLDFGSESEDIIGFGASNARGFHGPSRWFMVQEITSPRTKGSTLKSQERRNGVGMVLQTPFRKMPRHSLHTRK